MAIRKKYKREPGMIDFIQFVNDQTVIVSDPIFFKEAVEQYVEKKPKNRMGSLSLVNDK